METSEKRETKDGLFENGLVLFCAIALATAFSITLWRSDGDLGTNALVLAVLFTAVCLSVGFDNFQIGKLLSMARERRAVQKEAADAKHLNERLLAQLIQFTSSMNSSQHVQQTFQIGGPKVEPATEQEKQAAKDDAPDIVGAELPEAEAEVAVAAAPRIPYEQRRNVIQRLQEDALEKYLKDRRPGAMIVRSEVKITGLTESPDPISGREVIFDGYIKEDNRETFLEVSPLSSLSPTRFDRIYVRIARVYFYKLAKGVDASLVLLVVDFPDQYIFSNAGPYRRFAQSLPERFRPAILSGMLRIEWVTYSQAEVDRLIQEPVA